MGPSAPRLGTTHTLALVRALLSAPATDWEKHRNQMLLTMITDINNGPHFTKQTNIKSVIGVSSLSSPLTSCDWDTVEVEEEQQGAHTDPGRDPSRTPAEHFCLTRLVPLSLSCFSSFLIQLPSLPLPPHCPRLSAAVG